MIGESSIEASNRNRRRVSSSRLLQGLHWMLDALNIDHSGLAAVIFPVVMMPRCGEDVASEDLPLL